MRFYEFDRGQILIDGQDIKNYSQEAFAQVHRFSVARTSSSIMEPLLLISGMYHEELTDEETSDK